MIFDAHLHFFGREFYEYQTTLVPDGDHDALLEQIRESGVEIPDANAREHAKRWLAEMDRHEIDRAVVFASVPPEMDPVGRVAAESGGRLVPFAMVNPRDPVTIETLQRLQPTHRFRGILLFPSLNDYPIQSPDVTAALEVAKSHNMLVVVHCGRLRVTVRKLVGLEQDFPPHKSRPRDLVPVAREHPDLAFIVPHFGAGALDELLDLAERCPNVYTDTSGSNAWIVEHDPPLSLAEVFKEARESFGTERILYGSDSGAFPRGYRKELLTKQAEAMRNAGFKDRDQAAVLGGNLARLLGE